MARATAEFERSTARHRVRRIPGESYTFVSIFRGLQENFPIRPIIRLGSTGRRGPNAGGGSQPMVVLANKKGQLNPRALNSNRSSRENGTLDQHFHSRYGRQKLWFILERAKSHVTMTAQPTAAEMKRTSIARRILELLPLVGGGAVVLSAFFHWIAYPRLTENAAELPLMILFDTSTDTITPSLASILAALGFVGAILVTWDRRYWYRLGAGLLVAATAIAFFSQVSHIVGSSFLSRTHVRAVGPGPSVALAGALLLMLPPRLTSSKSRRPRKDSEQTGEDPDAHPLPVSTEEPAFSESTAVGPVASPIESRLRELNRLHGAGLISDQENTSLRREILDQLRTM